MPTTKLDAGCLKSKFKTKPVSSRKTPEEVWATNQIATK